MLEFDKLNVQVVPHFKGGQGEAHVRTAVCGGGQKKSGRKYGFALDKGRFI